MIGFKNLLLCCLEAVLLGVGGWGAVLVMPVTLKGHLQDILVHASFLTLLMPIYIITVTWSSDIFCVYHSG